MQSFDHTYHSDEMANLTYQNRATTQVRLLTLKTHADFGNSSFDEQFTFDWKGEARRLFHEYEESWRALADL